jgi:glycosyltransferase involved in cell wall biosynthesis
VGNAPEVVEQGENGYVFSYENQSYGIEIIREFMKRDKEWFEMASRKSLELAKERFGLEIVTERLLSEIDAKM